MAVALAYPESKQGKKDKATSGLNHEVEESYIRRARFVLRNCREKAEEVLRNAKYPLTVAYEEAQAIVEKQRLAEEEWQLQWRFLKQKEGEGISIHQNATRSRILAKRH